MLKNLVKSGENTGNSVKTAKNEAEVEPAHT